MVSRVLHGPAALCRAAAPRAQSLLSPARVAAAPWRCGRSRLATPLPQAASAPSSGGAVQVPDAATEAPPLPASHEALGQLSSVPQMWIWLAEYHSDRVALLDPHRTPPAEQTYSQVADLIKRFAAGLDALGINPGERVALFSEDSSRWLVADQACMLGGMIDCVRGVTSIPLEELSYIMQHTGVSALIAQDAATLDKLAPVLPQEVRLVVVLWGELPAAPLSTEHTVKVVTYEELLELGSRALEGSYRPPSLQPSDVATLVFTSGTSGQPKGAVLTHGNLLHQVHKLEVLGIEAGMKTVSYLPPWHIYGRTLQYAGFSRAVTTVYSTLWHLKQDLMDHQPNFFISVPLMLDSLQAKAMHYISKLPQPRRQAASALLNGCVRHARAVRVLEGTALEHAHAPPSSEERAAAAALAEALAPLAALAEEMFLPELRRELGLSQAWVVSGGGSLASHLDDFYQALGVPVLVGYGLTETSPVLSVRLHDNNIRGTIGPAFPDTEIRIVDPSTLEEVPDGQKGLIMAKGPGIMRGYYNLPEKTAEAFPLGDNTWFNTGDLGWRVPHGEHHAMGGSIVISGRAKDTIVLANGENVEPEPLEGLLQRSPYIQFATLMGQNKKALGALIVPDREALADAGKLDEAPEVVRGEVSRLLEGRQSHERVRAFTLLDAPFSVEDGTLTRSLKPKRNVIFDKYKEQVAEVERQLR